MPEKQLPVFETISIVIESIQRNFPAIIRMGVPVILVGLLSTVYHQFFAAEGGAAFTDFSLISIVFIVLSIIANIMSAVGIHRVYLLPPGEVANTSIFRWSSRESRFVGWSILMALWIIPVVIVISLLLTPVFLSVSGGLEGDLSPNGFMLPLLISLPIYYFFARWSLILPSTAIDGNLKGLKDSWKLTEGNGLPIFILVGVTPLLTGLLFSLLSSESSMLLNVGIQVLAWMAAVLEIGLLSHSYAFLSQGKGADSHITEVAM